MASTRSATAVYLIGTPDPDICETKLPSNKQVLSAFLHHGKEDHRGKEDHPGIIISGIQGCKYHMEQSRDPDTPTAALHHQN